VRILFLLPKARRWPWHDRLMAQLGEGHEVTVRRLPSPAYPLSLRLRLALEAKLFSGATAPVGADEQGAGVTSEVAANHDLVLDLSEAGLSVDGALVLRPLYDGSPDTVALAAQLLDRECPLLDVVDAGTGQVIASSYAAIEDKQVLGRGLAQAFGRVEALLIRACAQQGEPLSPLPSRPDRPRPSFRMARLFGSALRLASSKVLGRLRNRSARPNHWNVAIRWREGMPDLSGFELKDYTPLESDRSTFYADPFVIEDGGRHFLFAEAFPYATGKGVIVCAEVGQDGIAEPLRTVLERPYHLSYPYVMRHKDGIFMIPETSASPEGGIEIYRARAFPDDWVLEQRLLEGLALVDSSLFQHEGRLWLFAGLITNGGSSWDELFAWHAPALSGPWTPHRLNPIKSDCRGARPAGRPIRIDGRLLRPAQRCERSYGESLVWFEVTELTPEAFAETAVVEWGRSDPRISGIHSADLTSALEAIDFRSDLDARPGVPQTSRRSAHS